MIQYKYDIRTLLTTETCDIIKLQVQIIAVSDAIALIEDLGNQIPDKSWMLYLY